MDDVLAEFLTESNENLVQVDEELVQLERRPSDAALLSSIFRRVHTIKGTCGFLGLERLEGVAHSAENVLGLLRDGKLAATPPVISDILAAVDVIKAIVTELGATATEPAGDDSVLIARLDVWASGETPADVGAGAAAASAAANPIDEPNTLPVLAEPTSGPRKKATAKATVAAATAAPSAPAATATAAISATPAAAEHAAPTAEQSLRVNVTLLDRLMNMVGELVLSRNQLLQLTAADENSPFNAPTQSLDRITSELQEAVMKTRMQPIGGAWTKLPRIVRDLAVSSGKKLELVMKGAETELDRQILQAITDPLTHMVRNSGDHGIESPEDRIAAGKPEHGTITLSAAHEGGHIIIQVKDDGKGLDVRRIREKAVERGLATAEQVEKLPDAQVFRFIFEAGFSTAAKVTNVSGRGVGMDVVRSNIEKIGGSVELASKLGEGTTVRVKIPLTLAIISALQVRVGDEEFAIPQIGVLELVRVTPETSQPLVEVNGARFYRLRETLLPLVDLVGMLQTGGAAAPEEYAIVVCQVGECRFGMVVHEVYDTQDIVVKPVGRLVKHLRAYSGCTILGDGRVIMILDTTGISEMARVNSSEAAEAQKAAVEIAKREAEANQRRGEKGSLLLVDVGRAAMQAVPLSLVARLEEIPAARIEFADDRAVVQYNGELLTILPADASIDLRAMDPRPVVVFSDGQRQMGLAVNAIHDIVDDHLDIETRPSRVGVLGVAVIDGKATEVIDAHHFLLQAHPDWFQVADTVTVRSGGRILFVDDSTFFRELLAPVLRGQGYEVVTASDGREALSKFERGERFDVVLSDIDMPHVDGFSLAEAVRARGDFGTPKLVALTGRATAADRERGEEAGFDEYLVKLDRERLLATIDSICQAEAA